MTDSVSSADSLAPATLGDPPKPGEGCPTPLAWQQVLDEYRQGRVESEYETADGLVRIWEFGTGGPLYVLGGAAGDGELFSLMAWLLRDERQTVVVQFPDEVDASPRELVSRLAKMFGQVLQQRQAKSAPLLATGFGAAIALQAAVEFPENVGPMLLQGGVAGVEWSWIERVVLSLGRHLPGRLKHVPNWAKLATANHQPWFPPFDPTRWEFLLANLGSTPTREFSRRCAAWRDIGASNRYHEIRQRVLIVQTEGDGAAISNGEEALAAMLAESSIESMHSAGQFPCVTHPHRVVKILRDFLSAST